MKKAILYILFFVASFSVAGQDVIVNTEYPAVVAAGQQFNIVFTVNAGGGEFSVPAFTGFYKIIGPQTSFSSSTEIINGKISRSTSYSYVYYLQALKEGRYSIPPAKFKLKNKDYFSDSIHIEVVGNESAKQNASAAKKSATENAVVEPSGSELFVNLSLNRKEVYLGEHIVATVKLYTRVNLSGINEIKFPTFNGFLKTDIVTPPLNSLQQEFIDGNAYGTGVIQQFLLYPQITGEIKIEPVQVSVLVQQKAAQSDPFFGDFFSSYQTLPKIIESKELKVRVKPLPGIQPDDFSGIVGKIELKAAINKDSVKVNDAVSFKVTVSGTGNLKIASAPQIKLPPDIEIYDPKISDDIKNLANGTSGKRTFEYLLIPRHYGDFTIPSITYSYFNISTGKYEKLTTQEFHFYAIKGTEDNSGITVFGGLSKEDVKYIGKDIRFIKSVPGNMKISGNLLISKQSFYSAYIFTLFIFLLILFIRREHIRRNSDKSLVRNRKAGKVAGKKLHQASVCLKDQRIDEFYEEILKAVWGYISDKLSIPLSELTRVSAISRLVDCGVDDEKISMLNKILDTCEFARFSPSASGSEAETVFDDASQFIKSVENLIG